jgi:hypothetical protein
MYLRFVVAEIDQNTSRELGVCHALGNFAAKKCSTNTRRNQKRKLINGSTNISKTAKLTTAKPPHYRKQNKAISWFKDTAHDHLSRIRLLTQILENHGVAVKMLRTDRVGYIVYEDEFQNRGPNHSRKKPTSFYSSAFLFTLWVAASTATKAHAKIKGGFRPPNSSPLSLLRCVIASLLRLIPSAECEMECAQSLRHRSALPLSSRA